MTNSNVYERVLRLTSVLYDTAHTLDKWAEESQHGGWSTHQVKANRELANKLRQIADGR